MLHVWLWLWRYPPLFDDDTKIAQLELCVVLMSMAVWAPLMRSHHGIWWVDNIAALTDGTGSGP